MKSVKKFLRHQLHSIVVHLLFGLSRLLPLDFASWLGGVLGRYLGPVIACNAHRTAKQNLAMVFPDMGEEEQRLLLERMWDNLGRNAAELPHAGRALYERVTISGIENLPPDGRPVIFISGHFGNWELTYPMAHHNDKPVVLIYRHINNPQIDRLMRHYRSRHCIDMIPKGKQGAFKLAHHLKKRSSLALLVDQKMNDGIPVPFFGYEAMTAPAVAQLALRYDMPIIPAKVVRTRGVHFEGTIYPALKVENTGDREKDVLAVMNTINQMLEGWIREKPEQWFWVHRRWPKQA